MTGGNPMEAGRELDARIAEHVLGMTVRRVTPDWNRGREVTLFYLPGAALIEYSLDAALDAIMFRNGVDASDGMAQPLPAYSEDIAAAWEVVEKLAVCLPRITREVLPDGYRVQMSPRFVDAVVSPREVVATLAPFAICLTALQAVGVSSEGGSPG